VSAPSCSLLLPYQQPFDWKSLLGVFRAHEMPNLESVDDSGYERVVPMRKGLGWFRVTHHQDQSCLRLEVWNGNAEEHAAISSSVRRMFDLDVDPLVVARAMERDPDLKRIWERSPGLRVARFWSGYESMLGTILGQVVSVRFGRVLIRELMEASGAKARHPKTGEPISLFPTPEQVVKADLSTVRTSEARRAALRAFASLALDTTILREHATAPSELRRSLLSVAGVGPWTAEYVAMRGFHDDDAFPATDYGLKQELKRYPDMRVNRVRPWRAYAATALWMDYMRTSPAFAGG
jgi:DNA-3-methyladenine glycosylase II